MNIRELLKNKIPENYMNLIPRSFDIIGSIAIVEIDKQLKKYRRDIGRAIMKVNKNVLTVYEKASLREGVYRLRKLRYVSGERKSITLHKESGCKFMINVRTCYFSPREGTERIRVAKSIKYGERVMVFFAGMGPFPIVISKNSNAKEIYGVEINSQCVKYFKKNINLNKVNNIIPILGDVKKVYKKLSGFDRIIMPLPETAWKFLKYAKSCLNSKGLIQLYCIFSKEEDEKFWRGRIKRILPKSKIENIQKVLPFGPGKMKTRIDIRV